jgi:Cfr10I/Bse634I restriction endonuclease
MLSNTAWFTETSNGKFRINSRAIYRNLSSDIVTKLTQNYMVVSDLTPADKTIFSKAIAPHGVALEQNFNLVDDTYYYTRKADLLPLVIAAIQ